MEEVATELATELTAELEVTKHANPKASYDKEAIHYDGLRFRDIGGRLSADLDHALVMRALSPAPGRFVLDAPAGTGRTTVILARSGATVHALDLSAKMLDQARAKVATEQGVNVFFEHGSAAEMPYVDNYFDGISSLRFFHLLPASVRPPIVKEFYRVLKPGGILIAEFPRRAHAAGLTWLTRRLVRGRTRQYLSHRERQRLFERFELVDVLGGYFPGTRFLAGLSYSNALRTGIAIAHSPLRALTRQAFVVLRKPS